MRYFWIPVALLGLSGCFSARMSDREADQLFRSGQYDQAASHLKIGLDKEGESGRDLLLYLLDYGLALHSAGHYEEAIKVFQQADKVAEIKDYTSLLQESGTILTSENVKDYKGEEFENVLISAYLAMDYAALGETEDARVEAKRVNRKLERMVSEAGRNYQQNAFARYLSSILYEADRDWNGALVDLKKTREILPEFPGLGQDLYRVATLNGMADDAERFESEYGLTLEDKKAAMESAPRGKKGEIVVLYENGIGPVKVPNPSWYSLPIFKPRFNPVTQASVELFKDGASVRKKETQVLYNIEKVAIQNLEEKYGALIAKRIAARVAKEVVADQVERRTNNPWLGLLTRVVLVASDQADLRSWSLLPRDLQIARFTVEPGLYTVKLTPVGSGTLTEKMVQVGPSKKVFVNFRFMP